MDDETREQLKQHATTVIIGNATGPIHTGNGNQYNIGSHNSSSHIDTTDDTEEE